MTDLEERAAIVGFLEQMAEAAEKIANGLRFYDNCWGLSGDALQPHYWEDQATALRDATRAIKSGWHIGSVVADQTAKEERL